MNKDRKRGSSINISAPWDEDCRLVYLDDLDESSISDSAKHFVSERSKVHLAYIMEQEKSKRLGLILSVILLLSAMLIILFAPKDKEILSYWLGAALTIFSAGAAGYKRIWAKGPLVEFKAKE